MMASFTPLVTALGMLDLDQDGIHDRSTSSKRAFADYLRANQTGGERMMARVLHHLGIVAEPQAQVLGYIADFWDQERRVVFEVDGPSHKDREREDRARDAVMQAAGIRVIRLSNDGVRNLLQSIAGVRDAG